jgi:hypothetical protein
LADHSQIVDRQPEPLRFRHGRIERENLAALIGQRRDWSWRWMN